MYKNVKRKIERGVAFPTCVSVNNTVGHFSPLASDESVLRHADMVKIDVGCHIDGFIAIVAHTHVIQEGPITGKAADVIAAANTAPEVALRLLRPGKKNKDVMEALQKIAAAYDCRLVEGVLSHQLKQFVIDGNKVILNVSNPEVDEVEFEENVVEINQKFPIVPFSARALEEKKARLGLVECVNHELLQPYPVLHEKPGNLLIISFQLGLCGGLGRAD
ncbi:hypothetical protein MLD38_026532 [Melastoma candidum]|uniref:Uncharacterized protein n=1 Tax=Melastoma candidum TaxID=119954 RepID=A0ACB9NZE1_9MYRT|nr:hypothetical protein MLD38_026532 [Melastoma candidum]